LRFVRRVDQLSVRNAKQGQVSLAAHPETEIHGRVPVAFSPSLDSDRHLLTQRSDAVLPSLCFPQLQEAANK